MLTITPRKGCTCDCHHSIINYEHAAETLASVDEATERAKDHIRALRHRRNALVPSGRLPPEILCRAFAGDIRKSPLRSEEPPRILVLTAVCSTWRSVARSCPSLWTFIDFCYSTFARERLILAKNLPLIVWYKEDLINPLNSVLDLFSRSQGIDVSVHAEDWAKA
jgi:hypothetical protein